MIRDSVKPNGVLDTDKVTAAVLMHRNKSVPDTVLSSVEVVYDRKIKDLLPPAKGQFVVRPDQHKHMRAREIVLAKKHIKRGQERSEHCRTLKPLQLVETIDIQTQAGQFPKRWQVTCTIVKKDDFEK